MPSSESSNSRKLRRHSALSIALTWICRFLVGGAFIAGGWAKSIDPFGTLYKMLEYLNAWGLFEIPREPVVMGAVALAALELTVGVCVLCGVLRHSSVVAATALMAVMLPLTAYIAYANPVDHCGCFGDMIVLDNTTTLLKNIVLMACCVWLLIHNNDCGGMFRRSLRWAVVLLTAMYSLVLAAIGYMVQPLVDFRDYPLGTDMSADGGAIPVFGTDDEEEEIFESSGRQLIFAVPDPGQHFLTRSRFANELARYASKHDIATAAIVGTGARGLREWELLAAPEFDAYSADDTDIKALVRGDIAAIYLKDGRIVWKRNLASLDNDLVERAEGRADALDNIPAVDNGRLLMWISAIYLGILVLMGLFSIRWRRP
ncbi:MAG: DoxX family protein [Muribaculaceae bacterium]|nr:DoxX family protein [Muribaculaceae bacterium]